MSNELVGGFDALELQGRLLQLVVVLHPKHLDQATNRDAQQGAPGRMGVAWAPNVYKGGFILVRIAVLLGRSVHDVVRFLMSSEGGNWTVSAVRNAYLRGDNG